MRQPYLSIKFINYYKPVFYIMCFTTHYANI